jgi:FtsP/CotA-like multicopper oxidase with cupredoxin domain
VRLGVAERADVIIDFSQFAPGTTIRLENRLVQLDGRGPTGRIRPAGLGDQVLEFRVVLPAVDDQSANPKEIAAFYALPSTPRSEARITRTFRFGRVNSLWTVNDRLMECGVPRFRVKQNTAEIWRLESNSEGWHHPIHIHFEEFQILSRDPGGIANVDRSRKDVLRMFDERVELFFRFRDFTGLYPMHCHNTVHEDHAMMLTWEIDPVGDDTTRP